MPEGEDANGKPHKLRLYSIAVQDMEMISRVIPFLFASGNFSMKKMVKLLMVFALLIYVILSQELR